MSGSDKLVGCIEGMVVPDVLCPSCQDDILSDVGLVQLPALVCP